MIKLKCTQRSEAAFFLIKVLFESSTMIDIVYDSAIGRKAG